MSNDRGGSVSRDIEAVHSFEEPKLSHMSIAGPYRSCYHTETPLCRDAVSGFWWALGASWLVGWGQAKGTILVGDV